VIDIQRAISAFSIQTDEVPVLCTDVSCVGKCYLLLRKDFARWSQSVSPSVSQSVSQPTSQPNSHSISQSVSQTVSQSVSQSTS